MQALSPTTRIAAKCFDSWQANYLTNAYSTAVISRTRRARCQLPVRFGGALVLCWFLVLVCSYGLVVRFRQARLMPEPVVTDTATKVYSRPVMELVRQVWQSVGGQLLVSAEPAQAPAAVAAHYHSLFSKVCHARKHCF
jgi:hypothetical protein